MIFKHVLFLDSLELRFHFFLPLQGLQTEIVAETLFLMTNVQVTKRVV